jgi:hypothetical protein
MAFLCGFDTQEFFLTVKDIVRRSASSGPEMFLKWGQAELDLNKQLSVCNIFALISKLEVIVKQTVSNGNDGVALHRLIFVC